jgi:hypothetical protein
VSSLVNVQMYTLTDASAAYWDCRFADRDMVMRYHWGLAIGHTYTHAAASDGSVVHVSTANSETHEDDLALESDSASMPVDVLPPQNGENADQDDPELSFENREDNWTDVEEGDDDEENGDDDEFLDLNDMYGLNSYD